LSQTVSPSTRKAANSNIYGVLLQLRYQRLCPSVLERVLSICAAVPDTAFRRRFSIAAWAGMLLCFSCGLELCSPATAQVLNAAGAQAQGPAPSQDQTLAGAPDQSLVLSGAVRPWEFMGVPGQRSSILGDEAGHFEVWAYPLKILRNFHLNFLVDGETQSADSFVRSIVVRPSSVTLNYAGDTFTVRETLSVPVDQPAALIELDIETTLPLDIQAVFERDFQLQWPAGVGSSFVDWDPRIKAFAMEDEQKRYEAIIGSATTTSYHLEYDSNYSSSRQCSFNLGVVPKGTASKLIVIAASAGDKVAAGQLYRQILADPASIAQASSLYYKSQLNQYVRLSLPDAALQQAYEWAQVSMLQGLVDNPFLGKGLVAGYRTSGFDDRPGYAWFFGRDALWTSFALNAEGDFATSRTALEFLTKYQRDDGKIAHEISQGASFVPWFTHMPFAYAAADATPLYIIAVNDYVLHSGDVQFARDHWDAVAKAYKFLISTYDGHSLPQNTRFGHGWVEGGPLLPVKTELYQSSLGLEAIRAIGSLAHVLGKDDVSRQSTADFGRGLVYLDQAFWMPQKQEYVFGLDPKDNQMDVSSVLATVPMWFGLVPAQHGDATVTQLAAPEYQTDWGMRILSSKDPRYDPGGYHWGAVWPLFTGWTAEADYRYHRPLPAFSNLETNALLTFGLSPGRVTEVLSGNSYEPLSTDSPFQIWSSAMVVSPLLKGLLGLDVNALEHSVTFAPHVPALWTHFSVQNVKVGDSIVDLQYSKAVNSITLEVAHTQGSGAALDFSPAISLRSRVLRVSVDGKKYPFEVQTNANDQHVLVHLPLKAEHQTVTILLRDDFGLAAPVELPLLGTASRGVRVLSETWTPQHNALTLRIAGAAGEKYELGVWNPGQISSVDGGTLAPGDRDQAKISVQMPAAEGNPQVAVTLHFSAREKQ
jgi:glycogen debranching enzyme